MDIKDVRIFSCNMLKPPPLDASICVTDDFGLQMISLLQDKGYKNFTLMAADDDPELAERFVSYIKRYYFKVNQI